MFDSAVFSAEELDLFIKDLAAEMAKNEKERAVEILRKAFILSDKSRFFPRRRLSRRRFRL